MEPPKIKPIPREIRLFLSSTFRDMEAERNHLMTQVLPVVRRVCLERQVTFAEIDLRWGITESEAKNGRTVEICLEEIDRCRNVGVPPFFIGFLAERYGWIPRMEELANYWETRGDSPYAAVIQRALRTGISVTELELRFGFLDHPSEGPERAQVYVRSPSLTAAFARSPGRDDDFYEHQNEGKLNALKREIRARNNVGLDGYKTIEAFGDAVKEFLLREIDSLFPPEDVPSPFARQTHAHATYAQSRRQSYVALSGFRSKVLKLSKQASAEAGRAPIHVVAPSGLGKSAFLADLAQQFHDEFDATVFAHYTGADGTRFISGWRDRLIAFLQAAASLDAPVPTDADRWDILRTLLGSAATKLGRPVVLLIDALNQFDRPQAAVALLEKQTWPRGTALICTSTPEIEASEWTRLSLPALTREQRKLVVADFLTSYGKRLQPMQLRTIAGSDSCSVPLFLRLVLEELRLHARHDTLNLAIPSLLEHQDAGKLFLATLDAMDKDFEGPRHPNLGTLAAQCIAASRNGLGRINLAQLLDTSSATPEQRLVDQVLSPLIARLEPFCLYDDGRLLIMHDLLLQSLRRKGRGLTEARRALAAHFMSNDGFSVAERLFQFVALADKGAIVQTLGEIDALAAVWHTFPEVLTSALDLLDARGASASVHRSQLHAAWRDGITKVDVAPPGSEHIGIWLLDEDKASAGLAWQEPWVARQRRGKCNPVLLANSLFDLANLHWRQEQLGKAERGFKEALNLARSSLPAHEPLLDLFRQTLSSFYEGQGLFGKTEPLLVESLELARSVDPVNPIELFSSLSELGRLYQRQGRTKKAESAYLEAIEVFRGASLSRSIALAELLDGLATIYESKRPSRRAEAELLRCEAREIERDSARAQLRSWLSPAGLELVNRLNSAWSNGGAGNA